MSKEQLHAVLAAGAEFPPPQNGSLDDLRAWFEAINAQIPIAEGIGIEHVSFGAAQGDLIRPGSGGGDGLIVYFHGGGFIFGSARSHRVIASHLADRSGCSVLAVDYRLAPEHPAPAAYNDAIAAFHWALDRGYRSEKIVYAGDSAGGNIALQATLDLCGDGGKGPAALVLMSPALDFANEGDSHTSLSDAPLLTPELVGLYTSIHVGDRDPRSAAVTPLYRDLSSLPPVLIHVGTWERLRDDSLILAERLKAAGVPVEIKVWDGMVHSWQLFAPMLDEGMASIAEAANFANHALGH
ncbi:alpha/beta hydrolase [Pelagibacterium limicola]|uniref:alpha/beta hydrolase n=1 Tax=Pelagibacterium limicola TaxID=2791022 RepID=UPI0018AF6DB2|nr:alpha/beta hydrolase [Pelagibacterium limicola]